ncbi:DoxX family protein [Nocardioides alcanivorans]|uniref:DoxX family protein n=1 Tax=Nocardioides alcanivorans TaxID=2897352 RepID=UPI001F37F0F9|nr:DoxX family protein [Nocardioides alcanivorans]
MSTTLDHAGTTPAPTASEPSRTSDLLVGLVRIALGWVLLWAGLDKVFGLGWPTEREASVLEGNSPTEGYLTFGLNPDGPAHDLLSGWAGNPVVDVLYLAGTLGAGLALMLGVVIRIAALGGGVLMVMLWFSALPLEHNPFFDQHLFYALIAVVVAVSPAGRQLGLGRWWSGTPLVRKAPWLA